MIAIKILLALVSIVVGIVTMAAIWMTFHFFVPRKNSWTKSPLEQLGLKFSQSVLWGIGAGVLVYMMSDLYLKNHFPTYAKYQAESEMSRPTPGVTGSKDPDSSEETSELSPIPSSSNKSKQSEQVAPPNHDNIKEIEETIPDLGSEHRHENRTQKRDALSVAPNHFRSLTTPAKNEKKGSLRFVEEDLPQGVKEPITNQEAIHTETAKQENRESKKEPSPTPQVAMLGERYPETRLKLIDENFTKGLAYAQLRYAINEMYARHGAVFQQKEINRVFESMKWYSPDARLSFDQIEALHFTDLEKRNLKVLGEARNKKKGKKPAFPPDNPSNTPSKHELVRFIDNDGHLMSGPGTSFTLIRKPLKGERAVCERRSGIWILLRFDSGETGWTHERNLTQQSLPE